jgi:hypothetical protein
MSLINLVETSNLYITYLYIASQRAMWYQRFFDVQEHRGRRHIIVEIKGHVVR